MDPWGPRSLHKSAAVNSLGSEVESSPLERILLLVCREEQIVWIKDT